MRATLKTDAKTWKEAAEMAREFVTIVSGLPRSGTSMMMQSIEAGGIEALTDRIRKADVDNPKGYYEYEPVKKTKEDPSWLDSAGGKVVKMVYKLLYDLPPDYEYRVVFMRRSFDEVLASQAKMLERLGKKGGGVGDEKMKALFTQQLKEFEEWLAGQECLTVLDVDHRDMVENAVEQVRRINEFLGGDLDTNAMVAVVDPSLYRNKR